MAFYDVSTIEAAEAVLREDGSIWISIDDSEGHYLKVICDKVFGRNNFLADIIWNSTKSVTNTAIISDACTHTLVYFREKEYWVTNKIEFRLPENGSGFSNPDNDDPRGTWKADPFQVGGVGLISNMK
jgi:adenine-specific DNA-methyltransferase